ncbi:MAG: superoxide dismutase [Proteobacteria bacterium]|nr:superoxide dismutase [Pseudomonadota bacterium]
MSVYTAKKWTLTLDGLSQEQLEQHYKLYEGYVNNTNTLLQKIKEQIDGGANGLTPGLAELRRRLGWEYNGMRLHELYFDNLGAPAALDPSSALASRINEQWGSFDAWLADFKTVCTMRGVGWAILYADPHTGLLQNFWVTEHEQGHPAGFVPVLVMDIWEHAFTVDYKPTERAKYVEAFFKNINWSAAADRYRTVSALAAH